MFRLKVTPEDALSILSNARNEKLQEARPEHWMVDDDGVHVDGRSVCWLYCWAEDGAGRDAYDEIVDVPFAEFREKVGRAVARKRRYKWQITRARAEAYLGLMLGSHDAPRTCLVACRPSDLPWPSFADDIQAVRTGESLERDWDSLGNAQVGLGDRVFLLRQGLQPEGLVASGYVVSGRGRGEAAVVGDDQGGGARSFARLRLDALIDVDQSLALADIAPHLTESATPRVASEAVITLDAVDGGRVEETWSDHLAKLGFVLAQIAEEVACTEPLVEGATKRISVNAYERNPAARAKCIHHYGATCIVCAFDFAEAYGERGDGYIQVHHLVPLSDVRKEYEVDPIADLRPVCANCHAMLHRWRDRQVTIEELKGLMAGPNPSVPRSPESE